MNPYKSNPTVRSVTSVINAAAELQIQLDKGRTELSKKALGTSPKSHTDRAPSVIVPPTQD
jgi:hypothetical protein